MKNLDLSNIGLGNGSNGGLIIGAILVAVAIEVVFFYVFFTSDNRFKKRQDGYYDYYQQPQQPIAKRSGMTDNFLEEAKNAYNRLATV